MVPGMGLSLTIGQKADALRFEAPGSSGAEEGAFAPFGVHHVSSPVIYTLCMSASDALFSLEGWVSRAERAGRECGVWGLAAYNP